MRKPLPKRHKPETAAGRSFSTEQEFVNAVADRLQREKEQLQKKRLAWLSLPRLHVAIVEDVFKTEQTAKAPQKKWSLYAKRYFGLQRMEQNQKIREIAQKFGWTKQRLDQFKRAALAYRKEPSIKHYLAIRTEFPELDIQTGFSGETDPLFALEHKCRQYVIDPALVSAATDGFEPNIDKLCLALMERIVARDEISGLGQIQRRRATISNAMINYLIALMLEGFDRHNEEVRIPASLILLIRHQLGPLKGDLHDEYETREARHNAAWVAGQKLKPNERLSINRLIKLASGPDNPISHSTAARWLKDKDFQKWLQFSRQHAANQPKKLPARKR
jgi:hypothetical protein